MTWRVSADRNTSFLSLESLSTVCVRFFLFPNYCKISIRVGNVPLGEMHPTSCGWPKRLPIILCERDGFRRICRYRKNSKIFLLKWGEIPDILPLWMVQSVLVKENLYLGLSYSTPFFLVRYDKWCKIPRYPCLRVNNLNPDKQLNWVK